MQNSTLNLIIFLVVLSCVFLVLWKFKDNSQVLIWSGIALFGAVVVMFIVKNV